MVGVKEAPKRVKRTQIADLAAWQKAELGEEAYMMRFEKGMGK
jgi:hypothetical protein